MVVASVTPGGRYDLVPPCPPGGLDRVTWGGTVSPGVFSIGGGDRVTGQTTQRHGGFCAKSNPLNRSLFFFVINQLTLFQTTRLDGRVQIVTLAPQSNLDSDEKYIHPVITIFLNDSNSPNRYSLPSFNIASSPLYVLYHLDTSRRGLWIVNLNVCRN